MGDGGASFDAGQRAVLERIARGDPLSSVLEDIVRLIEQRAAGMACSILLFDERHGCVRHGAAPSLPAAFVAALDGLAVGPEEGSCGAAIARKERVVVEDIASHPYWSKYRALALPHGLRACWSSPIFSAERKVLGSFASYYSQPKAPSQEELGWVDAATHLTAVALMREHASAALRQSEERLRAVIEQTPDVAIQWYDEAGRILYCNGASEHMFGWQADNVVGKTLLEIGFFNAAEEERFGQARAAAAGGQRIEPLEFSYRRGDGARGFCLSTVFRIPATQSESCYVCMDVDLTERRRMEDAVRSSEALRAMIYSSVEDVIFHLNIEEPGKYRFVSVNPAFLKATGLSTGDVVGRCVDEVVPEPSRTLVLSRYAEAISSKKPVRWEEVSRYPAGVRHGEVTICPILDADGAIQSLVGTVHDITERRLAEEEQRRLENQLHQTQRLQSLGTLAGGIAHDFNNILAGVGANAELALMDLAEDHPARSHMADIVLAGHRAAGLVRQILTFGRKHEPRREVLDLRTLVSEALRLMRVSTPPNVKIHTHFSDDLPGVLADPVQIHQVIMNLGTNATHAVRSRGGSIEVRLAGCSIGADDTPSPDLSPGRYVCLSVSDDGCGMAPATLARVFDPFFTTKAPGDGTGLGLSVAHGIVKNHQGAITVHSELEVGTTFRVYLPVAESQTLAEPSRKPEQPGLRVLYVDDEEALVFLARRVLERHQLEITAFTDPAKALHEFRARPRAFDVVVTDIWMPHLDGISLSRELLAIRADIPIIMMSGYVRDEDSKAAEKVGVKQLLAKPHTIEELERTLLPVLKTLTRGSA